METQNKQLCHKGATVDHNYCLCYDCEEQLAKEDMNYELIEEKYFD